MDDIVLKNLMELKDTRNKKKILTESIKELQISIWKVILCIILSAFLSVYIAFFSDTVTATRSVINVFQDIELALFAAILGAYAIFQALMRDEIIKELIKTENNILKDSNRTFVNLSVLYIIDIFITLIIAIVVNAFPNEFCVYNALVSNILYAVFAFIYGVFNFFLVLENINFVINLYRMFNVYNIYRALDAIDEKKGK